MKVGSGGSARSAHISYDLSLANPAALADPLGKSAHMRVGRGIGTVVPDLDDPPVYRVLFLIQYLPIPDGHDGGSRTSRVIDPEVGSHFSRHRVKPPSGKTGTYTPELERGFEELFSEAPTGFIEIVLPAACRCEKNTHVCFPVVYKAGGKDIPVANKLPVSVILVNQNCKGISSPEIPEKVHLPCEKICQIHGKRRFFTNRIHGSKKGTLDNARYRQPENLIRDRFDAQCRRIIVKKNPQNSLIVRFILILNDPAILDI